MKVIKNINNNVSLCLDSNNNEVIAFGKGIGFMKPPYEIPLDKIQKTYYDVDPIYISMINDIPEEILDISLQVVDIARSQLENSISSNIVFTLADHIHFAIQRYQQHLNISLPIIYDIQHLFEKEMKIGMITLKMIEKQLKIFLPKEEATYIALHIINAEYINQDKKPEKVDQDYIDEITHIIEVYFNIVIDKNGFNYSRFVTHMHYLLQRSKKNEMLQSENSKIYDSLKTNYPQAYECSQLICHYLKKEINCILTEEECIYLMLHINRLCAREDCYR